MKKFVFIMLILLSICIGMTVHAENECIKISASEALTRLFSYIYTDNGKYMAKALNMVDLLLKTAEFYVIRCNMDISAAKTAYEVIIG